MAQIEKTVFISYRRTNVFMALTVYKDLSQHGYDVFIDYESIESGNFEQIIFQSIESRAHFIIILTPSALERCKDPNDWLRREIEHALKHKRNIIPLTFEGFDFDDMEKYLPRHIAQPLSKYNGLHVPSNYFDAAMERLRSRFLDVPIDLILHPTATAYETEQKRKAAQAPAVTENQLSAEDYFERGLKHQNVANQDFAIEDYTEAIRLKPDYSAAYLNRAVAFSSLKMYGKAIRDCDEVIRLAPNFGLGYNNRGVIYQQLSLYEEAQRDFEIAHRLDNSLGIPDKITTKPIILSSEPETVFLSYRRTNIFTAKAVRDNLVGRGYQVFFDYVSINSGDFEQIIKINIETSKHFICLLTPESLERCKDPKDWFRQELEHAIENGKNIVPLIFEGFNRNDFFEYLPSHLQVLADLDAVEISIEIDDFNASLDLMCEDYLTPKNWDYVKNRLKKAQRLIVQTIDDEKVKQEKRETPSKKLFVSYSSLNRDKVDQLVIGMQEAGYEVWYDNNLMGGQDWWDAILQAIRDCQIFCFVLSPNSLSSYPCMLEHDYAVALGKPLLPIKIADINHTSVSPNLAKRQYIDLIDLKDASINIPAMLLEAVKYLPECPQLPNPLPNPPSVPISPLNEISHMLKLYEISYEDQQAMVTLLERLIYHITQASEARELLTQLMNHPDTRVPTYKRIKFILTS